jgi:hypothetical protein
VQDERIVVHPLSPRTKDANGTSYPFNVLINKQVSGLWPSIHIHEQMVPCESTR